MKDLGDGKFKSIEPNEEILEIGKDENEETPEQLELERKRAEQEQNFEVSCSCHPITNLEHRVEICFQIMSPDVANMPFFIVIPKVLEFGLE